MGWVERAIAVVAGLVVSAVVFSVFGASAHELPRPPATPVPTVRTAPPPPAATPAAPVGVPSAPKPQVKKVITPRKNVGAVTTIADTVLRTKPWLGSRAIGPVPKGVLAAVLERRWGFSRS